jgi:hypothetical protein
MNCHLPVSAAANEPKERKEVKFTRYVPILAHWGRAGIALTLF